MQDSSSQSAPPDKNAADSDAYEHYVTKVSLYTGTKTRYIQYGELHN